MNIFLEDKGDGGEFALVGGDLKQDETLLTALYISLFSGKTFYNVYEKYKTDGDFERALNQPITLGNLKKTEDAAKKATEWFIAEGIAESIEVRAFGDINEKQNVEITIKEPSGVNKTYGVIWDNEKAILKAR